MQSETNMLPKKCILPHIHTQTHMTIKHQHITNDFLMQSRRKSTWIGDKLSPKHSACNNKIMWFVSSVPYVYFFLSFPAAVAVVNLPRERERERESNADWWRWATVVKSHNIHNSLPSYFTLCVIQLVWFLAFHVLSVFGIRIFSFFLLLFTIDLYDLLLFMWISTLLTVWVYVCVLYWEIISATQIYELNEKNDTCTHSHTHTHQKERKLNWLPFTIRLLFGFRSLLQCFYEAWK